MSEESNVLHITFKREPIREQHIRDAQRVDDWPGEELHEVVVDPDEITVEGTPEGIRWLYDMLHQLARDWKQEGEQWDADVAEEMARTVWDAVDGDLPDQQRTRRLSDGGQSNVGTPQCPECGDEGAENLVLDDVYECNNCVLQYNADGEVVARA